MMKFHSLTKYILFVVLVTLIFSPISAIAQEEPEIDWIDLNTDTNGDGLPDALVAEVMRIQALEISAATDEVQAQAIEAVVTALFERIPYAAETKQTRDTLDALQKQLLSIEEPGERDALLQDIENLSISLMVDPAYAITVHTFDAMLSEQSQDQPSAKHSLFIPLISAAQMSGAMVVDAPSLASTEDKLQKGELVADISAAATDAAPAWSSVSRGDILSIRGSWWSSTTNRILYCNTYCHSGAYDGNNMVFESNPGRGVRLERLNDPNRSWKQRGAYVGLAYNRYTSYSQDRAALDWAKSKWRTNGSTQYNYNPSDKGTDSKLYCSQLVWKLQRKNNYDVDSNNWTYLMSMYARWGLVGYTIAYYGVMPDEIALDNDIRVWSTGTNP